MEMTMPHAVAMSVGIVTVAVSLFKLKKSEPVTNDLVKSAVMDELLRSIKDILVSNNKIANQENIKLGLMQQKVNGTHTKINSMEMVLKGVESNTNDIKIDVHAISSKIN